jgi:hypothetical protein
MKEIIIWDEDWISTNETPQTTSVDIKTPTADYQYNKSPQPYQPNIIDVPTIHNLLQDSSEQGTRNFHVPTLSKTHISLKRARVRKHHFILSRHTTEAVVLFSVHLVGRHGCCLCFCSSVWILALVFGLWERGGSFEARRRRGRGEAGGRSWMVRTRFTIGSKSHGDMYLLNSYVKRVSLRVDFSFQLPAWTATDLVVEKRRQRHLDLEEPLPICKSTTPLPQRWHQLLYHTH